MALPLPRVVADIAPGGGINTALSGMNALANNLNLEKLSSAKAKYAEQVALADIMSKIAYANLVGLQPIGKILGNENAFASLPDSQKEAIIERFRRTGMGNIGGNSLNQMPQGVPLHSGTGEPSTNAFSGFLKNAFKTITGGNAESRPNPLQANNMPETNVRSYANSLQNPTAYEEPEPVSNNGGDSEEVRAYNEWMATPEGRREVDKGEAGNFPSSEEVIKWSRSKNMASPKTFAERVGEQKGVIREGEELGKHRAEDIKNLGEEQSMLAKSGAVLNRLTGIVKTDAFQNMRNSIPFFQDKQLAALKKIGTPEQQDLIGDFVSTAEAYKAATVNSFAGKPLVREFDLADRIKINEDDTVSVAEGKLRSLTALKKIAETKNNIILDLMENTHMNIGDAVNEANKMVDIKPIEQEVKKLLEPRISVTNAKTGETIMMPVSEARKRGVPNV